VPPGPVHLEIDSNGNSGGSASDGSNSDDSHEDIEDDEIEDFELGLTCWFVASSVPIVFCPACSWDSGARNAFDHIEGLHQSNLQERCTFDGQLRFEVSGPRDVTPQTTY
jgi:hypothetical protein